jgi:hypothetical protein
MGRITKTTSGRWEAKGNPAKWECDSAEKWQSKSVGAPDLKKVEQWIEDMDEWSEMMHEAVMELRERVGSLAILEQSHKELSAAVDSMREDLKRRLPAPGPKSPLEVPVESGKGGNK